MKTESSILENGDLQIILTFDSLDQSCLKHDLLDIVEWYSSGPSREKIYSCKKRMFNENKDKLMQSPDMQSKTMAEVNLIMNDEKEMCKAILKLPDYKNRKQREDLSI